MDVECHIKLLELMTRAAIPVKMDEDFPYALSVAKPFNLNSPGAD